MKRTTMTSLQRVLTTLNHREPDRVPLFLLPTMHGAKELDLSIRDYFDRAEHVAQGQLRLRSKYRHDCLYTFSMHRWKSKPGGERCSMRTTARPTPAAP